MLDGRAITPLYVQLMQELEQKISAGILTAEERLPSESELSKKYGVSLITVRKAVSGLAEKGLVEKKQGKGTYIIKKKYMKDMKNLQSFTELCGMYGVKAGGRMLENRLSVPDDRTAGLLGLKKGEQAVFISRIRYADGEPVVIEHNYFPVSYSFLLKEKFHDNSLFQYLREKKDVVVAGSEKWIELCKADGKEAGFLNVKKKAPLIRIRSITYNIQGEPVYAGIQIVNGECFSFYIYERGEQQLKGWL